jgi:hypothetical protein
VADGEADLRDHLAADVGAIVVGVGKLERRVDAQNGLTGHGLLTDHLVGPLWVHGTLVMTTDDLEAGSAGLPAPMSQDHALIALNGYLGTPPSGSAVTVGVGRIRQGGVVAVGSLTFGVGGRRARLLLSGPVAAGQADDLYAATVTAADSARAAADVVLWLDVAVGVVTQGGA